jgi:hypothetical protein
MMRTSTFLVSTALLLAIGATGCGDRSSDSGEGTGSDGSGDGSDDGSDDGDTGSSGGGTGGTETGSGGTGGSTGTTGGSGTGGTGETGSTGSTGTGTTGETGGGTTSGTGGTTGGGLITFCSDGGNECADGEVCMLSWCEGGDEGFCVVDDPSFCGGIAGFPCEPGLTCVTDACTDDAGGECLTPEEVAEVCAVQPTLWINC